jgi:hypothetical protein
MKRVVLAGVVLVVAAAAACSSPTTEAETSSEVPLPDGLAACNEIFVDGNPVDPATFGNACRTADDRLAVPRPAVLTCQDNRKLLWNDYAWGYEGTPMRLWPADTTNKVPVEETQRCLGDSAEAPPSGGSSGEGSSGDADPDA